MKIPLKPALLKTRRTKVKWIIVHHTAEIYDIPSAAVDNPQYQLPALQKGVLEKKQADINYNIVIDKIKDDYIPIVCRPHVYLCEWDDIDKNINNAAIHVALLGNYNYKIPEKRIYEILAYKVLAPFLKMYKLSPGKIMFHNEVSDEEDLACPGDFLDKAVVISQVRRFLVK